MTICRYYAQGTCRFGDRCRFEHIDSSYDSYNNYTQERYGRQDTGRTNYRNDYHHGNQRYEPKNYYAENQRSYSPDRYSDNYRYESSRYPTYHNQYDSSSRQGYEQQPRYNEQNYGRNQQYSPRNYQNENVQTQNRFRWLSDDYKKQTHQNVEHRSQYVNDTYNTSTPKGKVPFSFKVPESEIKKTSSPPFEVNEQDQLRAEMVKEDAKAWELGGQWPFTCYFPDPSKNGFPGFYDVSPEELRYMAYEAEKNNSYESYVQAVQNALARVNEQRSLLQIPTPQLLSILKQIWDGVDLYSTSRKIDPTAFTQFNNNVTTIESMETPTFTASASSAIPFSFKMPTETDSSVKTSVANFSFKLPAGTELKPVAVVSDGDPNIYTPFENLTDEEKEQFSASTFALGKIPTKPPPQALCI